MSGMMQIHAMAAVLRQGRGLAAVAWLCAGTALLLLCLWPLTTLSSAFALFSLFAGAVQAGYAVRVNFDHALLKGFAASGNDDDPARLDAALAALELRPAAVTPRSWADRWQGMRALLRGQCIALMVQVLLLLCAIWLRG
ncbi:hypothetical protein [Stenotrophomonas sp.]|uniref:hypothetical protein n=1 Tax=Stenotrophomonas sp. TaxID=69392 RepID=UPI0028AADBDD|nr:hypothetical protein [Stenotrophomonas sp.]